MAARRFSLCVKCANRQSDAKGFEPVEETDCFICRGLISKIPVMERKVLARMRLYEFHTFSVGMVMPADVQEREDQLRSELQIRGGETIKSQMSKEIASSISKNVRRKVNRVTPELTVLVDLRSDDVSLSAKSLFVYGRYSKPRDISQRRELCESCGGRGCGECSLGYSRSPSMEEVIGRRLMSVFRSTGAKFTWFGSEDADSLVYPPGRPFIAEVKNPKRRRSPKSLRLLTGRGLARVTGMRILKGKPRVIPSFVFETRAIIEPLQESELDLRFANRTRGVMVEYRNPKGKTILRRLHFVKVRRKGKTLVADMKLDGGLPVKRLVSGESASPSLSELLKTPLKCQRFDILRVWESGSFEFGKI